MPELTWTDAELDGLADALAPRLAARAAASRHAPESPGLMSVTAAAKLLGVHAKTVRRRIAEGTLPAVVEHGRTMLRTDELRAYVDGLEPVGAPRPERRRRPSARDYSFLRE